MTAGLQEVDDAGEERHSMLGGLREPAELLKMEHDGPSQTLV